MLALINTGWFGILAGLFGGSIISLYFYLKGQAKVSLAIKINHALIIAPDRHDDKLEVRYAGKIVPRVTRSIIGFWNNGNQTIRGSEISRRERLRILTEQPSEILRVNLLSNTRDATGVIDPVFDCHSALLDFDFLNPGDGFSVEVIHTGSADSITVAGVIQGMARDIGEPLPPGRTGPIILLLLTGVIVIVIALLTLSVFGLMLYVAYSRPFPFNVMIAAAVAGLAYLMWFMPDAKITAEDFRIRGVPKTISDSLITNIPWVYARQNQPNEEPNDAPRQ